MKIYLPCSTKQQIGGGITFLNNFVKGGKGKYEIVNTWQECDIILITSVTITERAEMEEAKKAGKKIVLRVDNMPKDSRNRGTAFSRMRDFGKMADWIVFQSEWAKNYVGWWLSKKHKALAMRDEPNADEQLGLDKYEPKNSVIYNGVDYDYFYHKDNPKERKGNVYLFIQYNRDENKRFPEAAYYFYQKSKEQEDIEFWCIGNFTPELVHNNFDFFNDEDITYIEPIADRQALGDVMRSAKYLLFPAYADASPNTVAEAIVCGCEVLLANDCGGTKEVIDKHTKGKYTIQDMANEYLTIFNKIIK